MIMSRVCLVGALVFGAVSDVTAQTAFAYAAGRSAVEVKCDAATSVLPVTWYFPRAQEWVGLVWLQHGFFRANEHVGALAAKMAGAGLVVVAPTIPSVQPSCAFNDVVGFVPNFARLFVDINHAQGALLTSARRAASAARVRVRRLPTRLAFVGHSAGGAAVTLAAKELVTVYPEQGVRLRGLVLLDPVETFARTMQASLPSLAQVPILALSGRPSGCNADRSGTDAVLALGRSFSGVDFPTGSHCDAEGISGNPVLCGLVCGSVRASNVWALHTLAVGWTLDLIVNRTTTQLYPGGSLFDALESADIIQAR